MSPRRQLVAAALAGASIVGLLGACSSPPDTVPPIVAECRPNGDPCYGSTTTTRVTEDMPAWCEAHGLPREGCTTEP